MSLPKPFYDEDGKRYTPYYGMRMRLRYYGCKWEAICFRSQLQSEHREIRVLAKGYVGSSDKSLGHNQKAPPNRFYLDRLRWLCARESSCREGLLETATLDRYGRDARATISQRRGRAPRQRGPVRQSPGKLVSLPRQSPPQCSSQNARRGTERVLTAGNRFVQGWAI